MSHFPCKCSFCEDEGQYDDEFGCVSYCPSPGCAAAIQRRVADRTALVTGTSGEMNQPCSYAQCALAGGHLGPHQAKGAVSMNIPEEDGDFDFLPPVMLSRCHQCNEENRAGWGYVCMSCIRNRGKEQSPLLYRLLMIEEDRALLARVNKYEEGAKKIEAAVEAEKAHPLLSDIFVAGMLHAAEILRRDK